MLHRLITTIADILAASNAPDAVIDRMETDGPFVALLHLRRAVTAGITHPSAAVYTVPAGKRAVLIMVLPNVSVQKDPGNRRMLISDGSSGATLVPAVQFGAFGIPGFTTDSPGGSPAFEFGAGVSLSLDLENQDGNPRTMGGAAIFKIVNA